MRPTSHRGFTLIEILVVVSLIVILAGILFPVFAQVREKARQTTCLSNLRQVSQAMQLYADEYDTRLPPAISREPGEAVYFPTTWMGLLVPYLKTPACFIDASSGRRDVDWHHSNDLLKNYAYPPSRRAAGRPFGTALWEGIGGFSGPPVGDYREPAPSRTQSEVARPTETILVCDHKVFDWGMADGKLYYPAPRHLCERDLRLPDGVLVPQGLINAAFVDGHVKALRHEQLWAICRINTAQGGPGRDVFRHFWPYD
jgi:prepilin-type N-terminal cleavage/methylation domain-containing protein/prepilin-type processing-associated H-X9-DG protein